MVINVVQCYVHLYGVIQGYDGVEKHNHQKMEQNFVQASDYARFIPDDKVIEDRLKKFGMAMEKEKLKESGMVIEDAECVRPMIGGSKKGEIER